MLYVPLVRIVPIGQRAHHLGTTSCTLLDAPVASAPMFQVTTPAASVPPPVADTNAVFRRHRVADHHPVALAFACSNSSGCR